MLFKIVLMVVAFFETLWLFAESLRKGQVFPVLFYVVEIGKKKYNMEAIKHGGGILLTWLGSVLLGLSHADSDVVPEWLKWGEELGAGMEYVTAFFSIVLMVMSLMMLRKRIQLKDKEIEEKELLIEKLKKDVQGEN